MNTPKSSPRSSPTLFSSPQYDIPKILAELNALKMRVALLESHLRLKDIIDGQKAEQDKDVIPATGYASFDR